MEEDEIALDKAIESGDTDLGMGAPIHCQLLMRILTNLLVQYVLMNLKKKHTLANFFRIINNRPVASNLIESSAREEDRELLKDMYYQDDRRADGGLVILRESVEQEVIFIGL